MDDCNREDLRAVLNTPSYWGVKDDGSVDLSDFCGDGDADSDNFDSYYCEGCGEFFNSWHEALQHVHNRKEGAKVAA